MPEALFGLFFGTILVGGILAILVLILCGILDVNPVLLYKLITTNKLGLHIDQIAVKPGDIVYVRENDDMFKCQILEKYVNNKI